MKNKNKSKNKRLLKWVYQINKKHINTVVLVVVLSAILAGMGTAAALLSRSVVDSAVAGIKEEFFRYTIILAVLYISNVLLNGVCRYLEEKCRTDIEMAFQTHFFKKVIETEYQHISAHHSGELLNRMTGDIHVIGDACASILPNIVSLATRAVCAFVVLYILQPWFAVLLLIFGIGVFLITRSLRAKIKFMHKKVQEADGIKRSFWQETFSNLLTVKAFSVERQSQSKSEQYQMQYKKTKMARTLVSVLGNGGYGMLLRIGNVVAFGWCGYQLMHGRISYGTLTAVLQLVSQLQQPFVGMSGIIPKYYAAIASAERLMEIEDLPSEKLDEAIDRDKLYLKMKNIEFANITFTYDKERIFDDAILQIKKGEFAAIMGDSGIGKSTLFKLLLGIYSADSGEIYIAKNNKSDSGGKNNNGLDLDGENNNGSDSDEKNNNEPNTDENENKVICGCETRPLFAYVPQGNMLFSGSIRENVMFANENAKENEIQEALKISCMDQFIKELPQGLETVVGEKGFGLSEGQVQRLAIARAILSKAPVLLFDEATSALDEQTEYMLLNNLKNLTHYTCLFVTHRKQALQVCDRQIKIQDGKIIG